MEPTRSFDLHLSGFLGSVAVEVLDSPGGQTNAPVESFCSVEPNALIDTLLTEESLKSFGRALWRCAFGPSQVAELWRASKGAVGSGGVLLLRLIIDSPELAALPWELLYDETQGRFLALDAQTPVTRFLRLPFAPLPWPQDRPLRLLFTAASPNEEYGKLHIDPQVIAQQWHGIEQVVAPLVKEGQLEANGVLEGDTRDALLAGLRRKVDIWHYLGHGQENGLLFVDSQGNVKLADAKTLEQLAAGGGVCLAVLNTCLAGAGGGQAASVAGALVRAGVPAVVAMQGEIHHDTALAFAGAFYDAIAVEQGVDQAVTSARKAILAMGASEWWMPALLMRTPEGRIWQQAAKIGVSEERARELAYLDSLIEKYRYWAEKYTPLAGIAEVRAAAGQGPRLDLPMLFMPAGFEKLEEHGFGMERRTERVPVDDLREAVARYKRLVLLGEPGSGKTTTLWRLAYDLAVAAKEDPQAPLPLLVSLGGYAGPESALAYAQGYFEELASYLPNYLRSQRVVLLLDGLNEMPQAGYKERVGRIQKLLDEYSAASVIVTCRALDYVEALRLEKLEVKPLDPDRQRAYLHRYLDGVEGEKLFWQMAGDEVAKLWQVWQEAGASWEQFWTANEILDAVYRRTSGVQDGLWKRLREGWLPPLWALGRNPFMLVMTAQVYAAHGVLPQNRGRLFAAFVDTLLGREEKRCDPAMWPGADPLRRGMARLAYAMQEAGERGTAVDGAWAGKQMAERGVDAKRIAYLCASATLLDVSDSQVRFVHQLVQEYFAALALAGRLEKGEDLRRYWPKDWTEPSGWEETFVLLAGMLPEMTPLIERLLPVNPALAARCIAESGGERPAESTFQAVQWRLVELMQDRRVAMRQRDAAGVAVNSIGDPRRGVGLRPDGLPDIDWVLVREKDPKTGRREFIYGDDSRGNRQVRTEPDFWMARYPITYVQFQVFLDAPDGFRNPRWWRGLDAPQEHRARWGEQWFKHWNHPRENVSWWDAMAFCQWLTAKAQEHPELLPEALRSRQGWIITLPTEWQWEKAARGHDGRQYPWGSKYEEGRANIDERYEQAGTHYLAKTTAVGIYGHRAPDDSPYGVADLSGNVWEWCLNEYSSGKTDLAGSASRVLRGGSWLSNHLGAAAPFRLSRHPVSRLNYIGFRVGCGVASAIALDSDAPSSGL